MIEAALRFSVELTTSAQRPLIASAWSECSGSRQTSSPLAVPAASTVCAQASSLDIRPAWLEPSAVTIAPVSVARSTIRSAP